jgi:hypothetical protein
MRASYRSLRLSIFPVSGLNRQILIMIESAKVAAAFKRAFDERFASREALPVGANR